MSTLRIDEFDIGYSETGSGTPLLFIHGTQPDRGVFAPTVAALRGRCRAITYDRRGFSESGGKKGADFNVHARDAAAILEKLDASQAIVVGWSWGGLVALELAALRPDLVKSIVLVEPAFHLKKHPTLNVLRAVISTQLLGMLGMKRKAVDGFFRWALGRKDQNSTYDTIEPSFRATVHRNASAIIAEIGCGTGEKLGTARVGEVRTGAVVLVGALSDPAFIAAADRVHGALPNSNLIKIDGAGHAIPLDRPDALADEILKLTGTQPSIAV